MTAEPGKDSLTDLLPPPGDHLKLVLEKAPELMAELMRQFIDKKDLNSRTALRLRMKALLDLVAVDTQYPPVAALSTGIGRRPERRLFEEQVMAQGPLYQDNPMMDAPPPAIAPIPGAVQAPNNEDILGG